MEIVHFGPVIFGQVNVSIVIIRLVREQSPQKELKNKDELKIKS